MDRVVPLGRLLGLPESGITHERVAATLRAKRRHWAMAWDELDLVAERPESIGDGIDEGLEVTARKVGAAYGPLEQDVTHDREVEPCVKKDHVARRVALSLIHI